ncbi:MFS transporter [Corynebacterium lipophiloflavum]|uniref:Transporter, major facilitator family protein n=1 Tax=Corynebacterium lipophiloflavum (strain ATCC 700352 / DSM 44291 / CCUG 37336 / JCM 10383 / DMMZ 1944) TaxID=525263 RepID=C0XRC9_CORLD|nr:transporter, major facilitator family protein [Corynebacterium lipophiloflavum DSM 44291]
MSSTVGTQVATHAPPQEASAAERRKVRLASTIGTTIEFYDFYAYATAAVAVFPFLFFPKSESDTVALLQSFATFGLAFIARPLGSVVFGHFGDRVGRKATLVFALLTMGIATFIIGLLPTYAQVGIWAPALLALMRFCQGLGLGGEWSGAALLSTETAAKGRRAWAAMWPQLGAPFGFFLSNGLFLILVTWLGHSTGDLEGAFMTWGWRVPFLMSAVMVAVGLWVRLQIEETPVFQQVIETDQKVSSPLSEVFAKAWRPLLQGTFIMVGCYTLFYLVTTWFLSYGIGSAAEGVGLGIPYVDFLKLQLVCIFGFMLGIPVACRLADTYGRRPVLGLTSVAIIIYGLSFGWLLNPESFTMISLGVFLFLGMVLMGMIFGPMSAILPELFPSNVRYTGSGVSYNVSSILGAAIAPFIATALNASYGPQAVGIYLSVVTAISLAAIVWAPETVNKEMHEI